MLLLGIIMWYILNYGNLDSVPEQQLATQYWVWIWVQATGFYRLSYASGASKVARMLEPWQSTRGAIQGFFPF